MTLTETARALPALLLAAAFLPAIFHPEPLAASEREVDLELVLAVDISRSMDVEEARVQRDGYVQAFRHPEVIQAIESGLIGQIVVTYVEWSGPSSQAIVAPWTLIEDAASADAFAQIISEAPLARWHGTSISGSLLFSARLFETSGFSGMRQVIDISGDGPNNMGMPVLAARDEVLAKGIVINGLPIMLRNEMWGGYSIPNLDHYYEDCVIGGIGAFSITVRSIDEFVAAIRRKLVLEIALPQPWSRIVRVQDGPRVDCMIGERLRRNWEP